MSISDARRARNTIGDDNKLRNKSLASDANSNADSPHQGQASELSEDEVKNASKASRIKGNALKRLNKRSASKFSF
jgi:hypothetical protein